MTSIPKPSDSQKFFQLARSISNTRALLEELRSDRWAKLPPGLWGKIEDSLDMPSLSVVLDRAAEDVRENLETARELTTQYGLTELGDRIQQLLENK